jgi:hypothetical protein
MAQVPYSAVPDVSPAGPATPRISVATPPAAFGATIAQALEGVGKEVGQAGNELFQRAMAIQELRNNSDAQQADANYMIAAGEVHAKFSALQGKDAVDAYPGYIQQLKDLREQTGGSLNPAARKLYDGSTLGTLGRTIFNGAGHAATQDKMYAANSATAQIGANQDAARYARDDADFDSYLGKIEGDVRYRGGLGGWGPEQIEQDVFKEKSTAWAKRIENISRTEPIRARQMYNEQLAKHTLHSVDIDRLDRVTNAELVSTGARQLATTTYNNATSHADFFSSRGDVRIQGLNPDLADRAYTAISAAEKATGATAKIESAVRTTEEQAKIRAEHEAMPGGVAAHPAARPGESLHELGQALDIGEGKVLDWLHANGERYGIHFPVKNDSGHMQMTDAPPAVRTGVTTVNEEDLIRNARAAAERADPGNTQLADQTVARALTMNQQTIKARREQQQNDQQTVTGALVAPRAAGQKLPTTLEELKADPQVWNAYSNLKPSQQMQVLNRLQANVTQGYQPTEEKLKRYQKLKGMAALGESQPEFVGMDLNEEALPNAWTSHLLDLQNRLKAKSEDDPRVSAALGNGDIQGMLRDAGIAKGTDDYYQFVGTLQGALTDAQGEQKAPLKPEEIRKIATQLLQQQTTPREWYWPFQGKEPTFQVMPHTESEQRQYDAIKNDPRWKELGIEPTDKQVQAVYARQKFKELYGKKTKPKEAAFLPVQGFGDEGGRPTVPTR